MLTSFVGALASYVTIIIFGQVVGRSRKSD